MYSVFGVTETVCEEKAAKLVAEGKYFKSNEVDEDGEHICHYAAGEIVEAMYSEMKPIKLSPVYSNKSEAEQYKALAEKHVRSRDLSIKRRVCPVDDDGDPIIDPKTQRPKYSWERI